MGDMRAPSRLTRPGTWVLFVLRNGIGGGEAEEKPPRQSGQESPLSQPSQSREDETEIGPAHCRTRNPGPVFWLWTVGMILQSVPCELAFPSGSTVARFATTDVHYSGASAADFHRLPVRR